jgi:hypothetical protein
MPPLYAIRLKGKGHEAFRVMSPAHAVTVCRLRHVGDFTNWKVR